MCINHSPTYDSAFKQSQFKIMTFILQTDVVHNEPTASSLIHKNLYI
jgi:hypothetical protein